MDKKQLNDYFNRTEWKRKLSIIINEHPQLRDMTGKIGMYLTRGDIRKTKIEDKEI